MQVTKKSKVRVPELKQENTGAN